MGLARFTAESHSASTFATRQVRVDDIRASNINRRSRKWERMGKNWKEEKNGSKYTNL
jgi:hypothetical protein